MNSSLRSLISFCFIFAAIYISNNLLSFAMLLFILNSFTEYKTYKNAIRNPLVYGLIIFFFIYLVSAFHGDPHDQAASRMSVKLGFLLFPISVFVILTTMNKNQRFKLFKKFIQTNSLAYFLFIIVAIFRIMINKSFHSYYTNGEVASSYLFYSGFSDGLIHPAYASLILGSSIIYLYFNGNQLFQKKHFYFHVIIHVLFLFQLQGRMNILSLIFVFTIIGIIWFINHPNKIKLAAPLLGVLLFGLGIWFIMPSSVKGRFNEPINFDYDLSAQSFDEFNGFTIRLAEWECAVHAISKSPWLGHGIGKSKEVLHESFKTKDFTYGLRQGYNAHNQYLEILLSVGILGLSFFVVIIGVFLWFAVSQKNTTSFFIILYTLLCFFTESYLERQWGVHFFTFMLPLFLFNAKMIDETY